MPTLQFFQVLHSRMPSEDNLNPKHTRIQIAVTKHIGAVTSTYGTVVIQLIIQGKAKSSNVNIISRFNSIYF